MVQNFAELFAPCCQTAGSLATTEPATQPADAEEEGGAAPAEGQPEYGLGDGPADGAQAPPRVSEECSEASE